MQAFASGVKMRNTKHEDALLSSGPFVYLDPIRMRDGCHGTIRPPLNQRTSNNDAVGFRSKDRRKEAA